jgi:hypothetical protein
VSPTPFFRLPSASTYLVAVCALGVSCGSATPAASDPSNDLATYLAYASAVREHTFQAAVRTWAAERLGCSDDALSLVDLGGHGYRIEGCGHTQVVACPAALTDEGTLGDGCVTLACAEGGARIECPSPEASP